MLCQKVPWRGVSPQASAEKSDSLRGSERGEIKLSVVLCSLMKKILEVLIRLPRNYVDYAERWASCARSRSSCAAPVLRWLGVRIARGLLPYTRLRMNSGIEERNTLPPSATSQPQATASPRPLFRCPFPFGKKTGLEVSIYEDVGIIDSERLIELLSPSEQAAAALAVRSMASASFG